MYLILKPTLLAAEFADRTDALEDMYVDYPELIRLTLKFWNLMEDVGREREVFLAAVGGYLSQRVAVRCKRFEEFVEYTQILSECLLELFESLKGQLSPLNEVFSNVPVYYLSRMFGNDLLLRVEPSTSTGVLHEILR